MEITVHYTNFDVSGYPSPVNVPSGTTAGQFIEQKVGGSFSDYTVKVNRVTAASTTVLSNNCELAVAPRKVAGGQS
jgi:hypothetical protein